MSFIDKLKNIILPKGQELFEASKKSKTSLVVDELVFAFEESVKRLMTEESLMFHTAYVVYVPRKYYNELHLTFGVLSREATRKFHKRLNEILKKNQSLTFTPLFDSWSFDMIALREDSEDIPDEENPEESKVTYDELEENFVAVRSSAVPSEIFDFTALPDDQEVKTNQSQPNSKFNRLQRLSIGAIRGLKPSGSGYSYPINLNGNEVSEGTEGGSDKVLATLKCADDNINFLDNQGNTYKVLDIRLKSFFIGGSSASPMYQGKPMIRIDSQVVMSPHFEIKQNMDGSFYIRPIGPVEQGQLPMPKDEWTRLSDRNASIKVNGNIELIFNKK